MKIVKLLDVANLERGTEPGSDSYCSSSEGTRFLRVGDITGKGYKEIYTNSDNVKLAIKNDVLMTFDGSPGFVNRGLSGAISSGIRKINPKDENILNRGYLYYALQINNVKRTILKYSSSQTIIHASKSIPHIEIPLPPLTEQKRIVEILEKADILRNKRQEADEKGSSIIQTIFLGMFGDPISNQEKWPIKSIGESVEFVDYGLPEKLSAAITSKEGMPIVRISNVLLDGSIDLSDMRYIPVSKAIENKLTLKDCDLLFNWRNGSPEHVGKTAMWRAIEGKHIFVSFLLRIRCKEGMTNPWYLWELINYHRRKDYFKNISRMQINTKFNATELRAMKIPVPSYDLQQKFADLIQKVEKIKEKQRESKAEIDNLFNSLMQKMFN